MHLKMCGSFQYDIFYSQKIIQITGSHAHFLTLGEARYGKIGKIKKPYKIVNKDKSVFFGCVIFPLLICALGLQYKVFFMYYPPYMSLIFIKFIHEFSWNEVNAIFFNNLTALSVSSSASKVKQGTMQECTNMKEMQLSRMPFYHQYFIVCAAQAFLKRVPSEAFFCQDDNLC